MEAGEEGAALKGKTVLDTLDATAKVPRSPPTGGGSRKSPSLQSPGLAISQGASGSSLVICYLPRDTEREKGWGKKILENKALSAFMVHQPPQSRIDGDQGFVSHPPLDSLGSQVVTFFPLTVLILSSPEPPLPESFLHILWGSTQAFPPPGSLP